MKILREGWVLSRLPHPAPFPASFGSFGIERRTPWVRRLANQVWFLALRATLAALAVRELGCWPATGLPL